MLRNVIHPRQHDFATKVRDGRNARTGAGKGAGNVFDPVFTMRDVVMKIYAHSSMYTQHMQVTAVQR